MASRGTCSGMASVASLVELVKFLLLFLCLCGCGFWAFLFFSNSALESEEKRKDKVWFPWILVAC